MASEIWTEKYRPSQFSEVVGQDEIIKKVQSLTNSLNIPHLLFAGPAGTGKSTLALIIVKELFGKNWHDNYLELNASDERGINVVREKVKNFARTKSLGDVPFKIIFLDEADALTPEAQQALRRTMENYSATCRFILSCNYSSKIIDPIQSRCAIFRFKLLEKKDIEKVMRKIEAGEKLQISNESVEMLYEGSEGDCRRTINLLQSTASISPVISPDLLSTVISSAKPKDVRIVLDYAISGDFEKSREKLLDVMLKESISGQDVIKSIQKEIWNLPVEPELKVKLTEKTGEAEFRIVEGSDPFIQLQSLLASFVLAGLGSKKENMQIIYDQAQDLTLIIDKEEKILLTKEKTNNFYDRPLKGISKTLEAYVLLAYSVNMSGVMYRTKNLSDIDGMGKIIIPEPEEKGSPWLINLSDEGIRHLTTGWNYGIRYNGSNKLFIIVKDEKMNIEEIIQTSKPEEELTRKDWEWLTKEAKKCKDCKNPIKQPEDYCIYHQKIYMDRTGSVI